MIRPTRILSVSPPLADQAYAAMREMITTGVFEPGQRLTERSLAQQLGVSPTPVREAISRLQHEQLLTRPDGRSLIVADPGPEYVHGMHLIQLALRGVAARLAAELATKAELEAIARTNELAKETQARRRGSAAKTTRETMLLNRQFHQQIEAASHNPGLVEMIATADAFILPARARAVHATFGGDFSVVIREHDALLEALTARDGETAEQLMRGHLLEAVGGFLKPPPHGESS